MPLIRRDPPAQPISRAAEPDLDTLLAGLHDPDPERRWSAARDLVGHNGAVSALAAAFSDHEQEDRVREAILTSLVRIGGRDAVRALLPSLRSDDAALRAGALDALQAMPDALLPELPALLDDTDPDVRLLAADLARCVPAHEATPLLCRLLDGEFDLNVCAAAVDVLAEMGTADAVPALERCAARFGSQAFIPFAVQVALQRIHADRS
jgi:HEAT repeat protein